MPSMQSATKLGLVILIFVATLAIGEMKKEYRFNVGPKASVSVLNQYGPISVKPSSTNQIVVTAILHSDKVEVDNDQSGNRVDIKSHLLPGATSENGRVDYEVLVPADTSVTLYSPTGPLRAEKLQGDLSMQGSTATVEVNDLSNGHVHVRTLNGPITLRNIHDGHVEITSVSGTVK